MDRVLRSTRKLVNYNLDNEVEFDSDSMEDLGEHAPVSGLTEDVTQTQGTTGVSGETVTEFVDESLANMDKVSVPGVIVTCPDSNPDQTLGGRGMSQSQVEQDTETNAINSLINDRTGETPSESSDINPGGVLAGESTELIASTPPVTVNSNVEPLATADLFAQFMANIDSKLDMGFAKIDSKFEQAEIRAKATLDAGLARIGTVVGGLRTEISEVKTCMNNRLAEISRDLENEAAKLRGENSALDSRVNKALEEARAAQINLMTQEFAKVQNETANEFSVMRENIQRAETTASQGMRRVNDCEALVAENQAVLQAQGETLATLQANAQRSHDLLRRDLERSLADMNAQGIENEKRFDRVGCSISELRSQLSAANGSPTHAGSDRVGSLAEGYATGGPGDAVGPGCLSSAGQLVAVTGADVASSGRSDESNRPDEEGTGVSQISNVTAPQSNIAVGPLVDRGTESLVALIPGGGSVRSVDRTSYCPKVLAKVKIEELPVFVGPATGNPVEFIDKLRRYFQLRKACPDDYIEEIADTLKGESALWYKLQGRRAMTFSEFEEKFLSRYWNQSIQRQIRDRWIRSRYHPGPGTSRAGHVRRCVEQLRYMRPVMDESDILSVCIDQFCPDVIRNLRVHRDWSLEGLTSYLESIEGCEYRDEYYGEKNDPRPDKRNRPQVHHMQFQDTHAPKTKKRKGHKNASRGDDQYRPPPKQISKKGPGMKNGKGVPAREDQPQAERPAPSAPPEVLLEATANASENSTRKQ